MTPAAGASSTDRRRRPAGSPRTCSVAEYSLLEQVHNLPAWLDVFAVLYPQLQNIDFRIRAAQLEVPVYLVQGRHELPGRATLVDEWFQLLNAPNKQIRTQLMENFERIQKGVCRRCDQSTELPMGGRGR